MPDGSRTCSSSPTDLGRVAQLFREHLVFVRRVLRRCGVQPGDLDDAVQETFLVVHRRIGDFEGRATERTWLYSVAMRVASTQRRTAMRESKRRERAGAQMHATRQVDPERELSSSEAAAVLDELLDELDEGKRRVFVLAELEGVPVPQVAQILDLNVRTAHSRLRLARERFSAALARHHAREEGLARRVGLRALARRGRPAAPTGAQRRASWAALAVQLGGGPPVVLAVPWWAAFGGTIPFAATVVVGIAGLAVAWAVTRPAAVDRVEAAPAVAEAAAPDASAAVVGQARTEHLPQHRIAPADEAAEVRVHTPRTVKPQVRGAAPVPTKSASVRVLTPTPGVGAGADGLLAETRLLEGARGHERRGKLEAALAALDEHRRRFPDGVLRSERLSTRIRVLCELGRVDDASESATTPALQAVVHAHCEREPSVEEEPPPATR